MNVETIQMLHDYSYWAHRRVWDCILHLTDKQFLQPLDFSIGSIRNQVAHVMSAEWIWLSRLQGVSPIAMFDPEAYPDRAAVRTRWDGIESDVRRYLASLTNADLDRPVSYRSTEGKPHIRITREILLHLANHGTDHRAQILAMLHKLGAPTVEQDLIFYLIARDSSA